MDFPRTPQPKRVSRRMPLTLIAAAACYAAQKSIAYATGCAASDLTCDPNPPKEKPPKEAKKGPKK